MTTQDRVGIVVGLVVGVAIGLAFTAPLSYLLATICGGCAGFVVKEIL